MVKTVKKKAAAKPAPTKTAARRPPSVAGVPPAKTDLW
jgi:hypothetical protein